MKILPRSTQSARRLVLFFLALFAALAVSLFSDQATCRAQGRTQWVPAFRRSTETAEKRSPSR